MIFIIVYSQSLCRERTWWRRVCEQAGFRCSWWHHGVMRLFKSRHTKRTKTSKFLAHLLFLLLGLNLEKTWTKGRRRFTARLIRANRRRSNTWIPKQEVIRMEFLRTDIRPVCESGWVQTDTLRAPERSLSARWVRLEHTSSKLYRQTRLRWCDLAFLDDCLLLHSLWICMNVWNVRG